jgi:molybdopterin converting factor small subunit
MTETVEIKLFATLNRFLPAAPERYPISPGMTARELIRELKIPEAQAKLVFIDGVKTDPDTALKPGQRVGIFPPVGGG